MELHPAAIFEMRTGSVEDFPGAISIREKVDLQKHNKKTWINFNACLILCTSEYSEL